VAKGAVLRKKRTTGLNQCARVRLRRGLGSLTRGHMGAQERGQAELERVTKETLH
jgi:hypothetical protein